MGKLVDQAQLGRPAQDRREVHLLQLGVAVAHPPPGDRLQARRLSDGLGPTVSLEVADRDVVPGLGLGLAFLKHPIGLSDSRGHA